MSTEPVILKARDLSVSFGDVAAVTGLDLEVLPGQIVALVGPNGAGKTSTLEAIVGLRPLRTGVIEVCGLGVREAIARGLVGVMLQSGGPYPAASPGQRLRYLSRIHAAKGARAAGTSGSRDAADLLAAVGIDARRRVKLRRMSGGEQQRVKLAAAMLADPPLLILDEPTAGLDASGRADLLALIASLRGLGRGIVMTTHRLDDVDEVADHVIVLAAGQKVREGTPAELVGAGMAIRFRARPGLPVGELVSVLREFIDDSSTNSAAPPLTAAEVDPGAYVIAGPVSPATVAAVVSWCAGHSVIPEQLRTDRADLDAVISDAGRETAG